MFTILSALSNARLAVRRDQIVVNNLCNKIIS